jgi:hypothetical protein
MNYKAALEYYKDVPRSSIEEFIEFGKTNFVFLQKMYGAGFVLQAIEIAELLKEKNDQKNCTGHRDEHGSRYDPFVRNSGH